MSDNALTLLAASFRQDAYEQGMTYPGLTFMRTEFVDHRRWAVHYLDVYLHLPTGTYAGVSYSVGATEMQDHDPDGRIVPVELDPTPRFRFKQVPR